MPQVIPEVLVCSLYDTVYFLAPRGNLSNTETLFSVPIGGMHKTPGGWRAKTPEETNLAVPGLDSGQSFVVRDIRCALMGDRIFHLSSPYYCDLWLRLSVRRKTYWEGPAWRCVDPATVLISPSAFASMKRPDRKKLLGLQRPLLNDGVYINTQELFCVTAVFGKSWREPSDNAPNRLVVFLDGQLVRPSV